MKEIKYISDKDFHELTKKQKLEMTEYSNYNEIEIDRLVLIPLNKKMKVDKGFLNHYILH